jgi:hypothetical protein
MFFMAENKKSFVLYADLIHTVRHLSKEDTGELFMHILSYVNDENPITNNPIVKVTFEPVKQQLKRDLVKWSEIREKRSEAGRLSAEKKRQQTATKSTSVESVEQTATKSTVSVNVNDNVNVNDSVSVINNTRDLSFYGNFETVSKNITEDEIFLTEAAHLLNTSIETVKEFSEKKLLEMKATGAISRYSVSAIRGFILKDFKQQKEKEPKLKDNSAGAMLAQLERIRRKNGQL